MAGKIKTTDRNYGIDILRFVAMQGIVILHTLGRSGLLGSHQLSQYRTAWFLEIIVYASVNCFGMISGFVNYSDDPKPFRLTRLIELWAQVFVYGVCTLLIFRFVLHITPSKSAVIMAIAPLLKGEYWYFSAFAGVYLISPIVLNYIRNTDNKTLLRMAGVLFAFFSVLETVSLMAHGKHAISNTMGGYSFVWLLLMYIAGAIIRKTEVYKVCSAWKAGLCLTICILFTYAWQMIIVSSGGSTAVARLFTRYISPTVVIAAICSVCLFSRIRIRHAPIRKTIAFITPSVFSIYLLNSQPMIVKYAYNREHLRFLSELNPLILIISVLFLSLAFCIGSIGVDQIRKLFFRILRIRLLAAYVEKGIWSVCGIFARTGEK